MEKKSFLIPNISCKHCVMTIKNELSTIDGISKIEGDSGKKEITVEWKTPATLEKIKSLLKEVNYPPAD